MIINKYYLYLVILLAAVLPTLGPKLYYRLTYEHAEGRVVGFHEEFVPTKTGGYTKRYPQVEFHTADAKVTFYAPSFMEDVTNQNNDVEVLYDKKDPTKAFINSSLGIFGTNLVWILPLFLIVTGCFFGPGIIPTRFTLNSKEIDKKLFG